MKQSNNKALDTDETIVTVMTIVALVATTPIVFFLAFITHQRSENGRNILQK